ncbi:YcaO-like family protein [Rhodococcus sp. 14-2483-1-1]|uniref:YcaO-like family protein n=1 Tax=Rhodococcus sp. 14-2483-1-1 TaxID=2023148 RepID=UPI0014820EE7|nr:YcaO-like family protein [Rhodococcus sp. 14-2483-1-1]
MATLNPNNGLARGWTLNPPRPPSSLLWTVAVDIGMLDALQSDVHEHPLHAVGASGPDRRDAMVRAAGEAVERYALVARADREPQGVSADDIDPGEPTLDVVSEGLCSSSAPLHELRWYRGRCLATGGPVWVPAGTVDFPGHSEWFDVTPSGAAAGPDVEFATTGALLEWVERDALQTVWASGNPLQTIDVASHSASSAHARALSKLMMAVDAAGLAVQFCSIPSPTAIPCVVAAIVSDGVVAVGAKAHPDPARAMVVALQESLQVRSAMIAIREVHGDSAPVGGVRSDLDRALTWMSPGASEEWNGRVDDVRRGLPEPVEKDSGDSTIGETVLRRVQTSRGRPVVVELTDRLPEVHRDMGWCAVKVLVPGFQPLRMDETTSHGWRLDRIDGGVVAAGRPHPLI